MNSAVILKERLVKYLSEPDDHIGFDIYIVEIIDPADNKKKKALFIEAIAPGIHLGALRFETCTNATVVQPSITLIARGCNYCIEWFKKVKKEK